MKEQRAHQMQVMEEQEISTWTQVGSVVTEQLVEKQKGKIAWKKRRGKSSGIFLYSQDVEWR